MKIRQLNEPQKEFKPIELVLTIESKRELEMLWLLFNGSPGATMMFINDRDKGNYNIDRFTANDIMHIYNDSKIWEFFEQKMKEL